MTKYIIGSIDVSVWLCYLPHSGAFVPTNNQEEATRYDFMSVAQIELSKCELGSKAARALNLIVIPIEVPSPNELTQPNLL